MRTFAVRIFIICVLTIPLNMTISGNILAASPPEVSAEAAAMMDVDSGRLLYAKNAHAEKPIASITKIMTAIIAIEHGDLDEKVTVSSTAAGTEGSSIYLKAGEQMELRHLLYGLMLRSGNDAAVAIAEHIGGSIEGFTVLMNEKAQYLGLTHSHFKNPHGLDEDQHYSSAYDMAKLTAYALKNDVFQKIAATRVIRVPNPEEPWDHKWYNKNKMLHMYAGADGVKTGYTSQAQRTLVSSATKNGQQLVTVTLNAADDWKDSIRLLNYGFQTYAERTIVDKNHPVEQVMTKDKASVTLSVVPEHTFAYPLTEEESATIEKKVVVPGELPPGLTAGVRVGEMTITLAGEKIGSVPLVTKNLNKKSTGARLWIDWVTLLSPVWKVREP